MRDAPDIVNALHLHGNTEAFRPQMDEFRPHPDLDAPAGRQGRISPAQLDRMPVEPRRRALDLGRQDIHAGRADEVADEGMRGAFEELLRRAHLHHGAVVHDDDLVGEGERFGLVVGHVDHRDVEPAVQILERRAQLPFEMRVDHRERLVEQDRSDVCPHQPAAERDLLLKVGGQIARLPLEHALKAEQSRDFLDAGGDDIPRNPPILEREGEVPGDRHRVVDHRELEYLRDVARLRRQGGDVAVVEEDAPARRDDEARDDVQKRGLAAAGRAEKGVGAALLPDVVDLLQGVVRWPARIGAVANARDGQG